MLVGLLGRLDRRLGVQRSLVGGAFRQGRGAGRLLRR
jgi:hypothetical protein